MRKLRVVRKREREKSLKYLDENGKELILIEYHIEQNEIIK